MDDEFTSEDRGRYKPPILDGDLSYSEVEKKVLAAIDADHRTLPQIKKHARLEPGFNLDPVIEGMVLEYVLRRESNGTITAYFRHAQKPTRFWLNGNGTVHAEFDETFVPRDEPKKAKEIAERDYGHYEDPLPEEKKGRPGHSVKVVDPDELEEAAFEHTTQEGIAAAVGISIGNLRVKMKTDSTLREAYNRGRDRRAEAENQQAAPPAAKPEAVSEPLQPKRRGMKPIDVDADALENAAAERGTIVARAAALKLGQSTLYSKLKSSPEHRAAYERGRTAYLERNLEKVDHKPGRSSQYRSIDLEKLEALAETEPNTKAIAAHFGMSDQGLRDKMRREPEIRAVFDRGREKWRTAGGKHASRPYRRIEAERDRS